MIPNALGLIRLWTTAALSLSLLAAPALAESETERLGATVHELETRLDARIGVLVRDSGTGWEWGHREDERFLMASTFKSVLCAAVLDRVEQGALDLDEPIAVREEDLLEYAPVARQHLGGTLSVAELCLATLDMSDNTAANLLIDRLGGPGEVTAYLRRIGDPVTRLDRKEPELNLFVPGDPRDTTTPAAMLSTWEAMLLREALAPGSRAQLAEWMSHGGVTGALLRASTPADWQVVDKSGGGDNTRNLVAMITPPERAPFFVAIYLSDTSASWDDRNAAVTEIGAAVVDVIRAR